jgi:hypothetical protein
MTVNKTDAIDKRLQTISPLNKSPTRSILERIVIALFSCILQTFIPASKHPSQRRINLPALVKAHSTVNINRRTDLKVTDKEVPAKSFEADWIEPALFRDRYILYLTGMNAVFDTI